MLPRTSALFNLTMIIFFICMFELQTSQKETETDQVNEIESSTQNSNSEFKSDNIVSQSKLIELDKIYRLSSDWIEFTNSSSFDTKSKKFHLIIIKGFGNFSIKSKTKSSNKEKVYNLNLDSSYELSYIPINSHLFLKEKGDKLYLKLEKGFLSPNDKNDLPEIKFQLVDGIQMEFNQNHRIITHFNHKISYKVTRPDLHLNKEGKDDRLQFMLQSSLDQQILKGNEELSMYINSKKEYPTSSFYDFKATGNLGFGLVKSLHKGNNNYCINVDCEYFITIYSHNVDYLYFFPTVFANFSELNFHNHLFLLEEIEGKEEVSYELNVPDHQGDWVFKIEPIEGYPKMFINPDQKPNSLKKYKYKAHGERAEMVRITRKQSDRYKFSHKKFFVTFSSEQNDEFVSSFKFEVLKIKSDEIKYIDMNYTETSVVANQEIIPYKLQFLVDQPEYIDFVLTIASASGNSILLLKECFDDNDSCQVTYEDVTTCKNMIRNTETENNNSQIKSRRLQAERNLRPIDQNSQISAGRADNQQYYDSNANTYSQGYKVDPSIQNQLNSSNNNQSNENNIQNSDMISQREIQQNMSNSQIQNLNQFSKPLNSNQNPNQNELTNMLVKQLQNEIQKQNLQKSLNSSKKKAEMNYIKDYDNAYKKGNVNQNRNQENNQETIDLQSIDSDPKPEGFNYEIPNFVQEKKIKCVEINPKNKKIMTKSIYMQFNCIGYQNKRSGKTFEQLNKDVKFSQNCLFAVGIYGSNPIGHSFSGSYYSLTGKGGLIHKDLQMRESKEITVDEMDEKYIRIDLKKYSVSDDSQIKLQIVAVTGNFNVYVSRFNQYPSEDDNEATVSFSNENFVSLKTSSKTLTVNFDTYGPFASFFITIEAEEYSVVDLYAHKISKNDKNQINENLLNGKTIKRKIEKQNLISVLSNSEKKVFGKSFHFMLKNNISHHDRSPKIVLNSNMLGLKMCLQKDQKEFIPEQECLLSSDTGVLEIPNIVNEINPHSLWNLTVLYEAYFSLNQMIRLPLDFSLVLYNGKEASHQLTLVEPGITLNSTIKKGEEMILKINLLNVEDSSLFLLKTEDRSLRAEFSLSEYNFSNPKYVLDMDNFGLEINFEEQVVLCMATDNSDCIFYVRISSKHKDLTRFSFTYTIDDIPMTMTEGNQLYIPNKRNMYFLYDPDILFPVEFNLESDSTEFLVYSKFISLDLLRKKNITQILNEISYDFKTDINKIEQLRIPQKNVAKMGTNSYIGFLVAPKFGKTESNAPTILYSKNDITRVHVKSRMSLLDPHVEGVAILKKGEMRHFYFNVDNETEFSLIMTVISGKADLYLNKGMFNLPTVKSYWKRKKGSVDEEIRIKPEMFDNNSNIKGVYTAGIYAHTNCKISVIFMPDYENIRKIKPQQLLNTKLKKNKFYYFEFFNKMPKWMSYIYSENSSLEISVRKFSIQKDEKKDLTEILEDNLKYLETLSFPKGSLPLQHIEENASEDIHYVVRVKSLDNDGDLELMVYEENKAIEIPNKKNVSFSGDENQSVIFLVHLHEEYEKASIKIQLHFGDVEFIYGTDEEKLQKKTNSVEMSHPSVKSILFKEKEKKSDIVLFEYIYIKCNFKKFSRFSLEVKGKEMFEEIKSYQTKMLYLNKNDEQNVFFYLNKNQSKQTKSFSFDIFTLNVFDGSPKLFFNPENEDLEFGKESKFLPMPINDKLETQSGQFKHIQIFPKILSGYFILQLPKHKNQIPFKISVGLNDTKSLQLNGTFRYQLPNKEHKTHKYSMFLPEEGEFRFLLESCQKLEVKNAKILKEETREYQSFKKNLCESKKYLFIDETTNNSEEMKNYQMNVFRGKADSPGLLEFNVESESVTNSNKEYLMVTEFKPLSRNLFYKDYLDLNDQSKKISYKWKSDSLTVILSNPKFKDQLLIDFPNIKQIVVKFFVHVFSDDKYFNKRLEQCGLTAVEETNHIKETFVSVITVNDQFNDNLSFQKEISFVFDKKNLNKLNKKNILDIFTYISVDYLENDFDEYEISLDQKFAITPFVYMRIYNKFQGGSSFWFFLCVLVLIGLAIFGFINYQNIKKDSTQVENKEEYKNVNKPYDGSFSGFVNPNQNNPANKIEMNEFKE